MPNKRLHHAILFVVIVLLISIPLTTPGFAQDATPIPVLPESTEDSAAPLAPDTPAETGDTADTVAPEATAAVGEEGVPDLAVDSGSTCPVAIEDSFTATEILCTDIAPGEACIGNGTVDAVFGADLGTSFSQASDLVQISNLDQLTLTSSTTWTVVQAELELSSTEFGNLVSATTFIYGNLTLTDAGEGSTGGARNGTVLAQQGMNVRRTPGNDGVVVWQLQGGDEITVTGISADRQWIRMIIPNQFAGTGWAYAPYIDVEGGAETLDIVGVNSPQPSLAPPEFTSGQAFELLSALPSTDCKEEVPISGLLLQSPSGTPDSLKLKINGAEIQFNGTIFIQAQAGDVLRVSVIEGQASVIANGSQAPASANFRVDLPLDNNLVVNGAPQAAPFDLAELPAIPLRLLPRQVAPRFEESVGDSESVDDESGTSETTETTSDTQSSSTECLLSSDEVRNIRAEASTESDVVQVLQPGDSVIGVGQAIGELNLTWYQTEAGGWIRIDTIDATDACTSVPVVEAPQSATPTPTVTPQPIPRLSSSVLSEVTCDGTDSITASASSDGSEPFLVLGGTWAASVGTVAEITTEGGEFNPAFGAQIRLIKDNGDIMATSGRGTSLTFVFQENSIFEMHFSATEGDTVIISVSCH